MREDRVDNEADDSGSPSTILVFIFGCTSGRVRDFFRYYAREGKMLFFYLIEENASPVQLVSFFLFFSFFHFVVVYKSILRAREECCCSNRRAQRMLECLGQVVRLSFFFHSPLFRFPPFWTAKDLYSDSCFAYDIALPWVTQCLFFPLFA